MKYLQNEVTPKYAVAWKTLGLELGLDEGVLQQSEADYRFVADQCNDMLKKWLRKDPNANKAKLSRALHSPAVKAVMRPHQPPGKISLCHFQASTISVSGRKPREILSHAFIIEILHLTVPSNSLY